MPDGEHVIGVMVGGGESLLPQINIVLNWFDEVRQFVLPKQQPHGTRFAAKLHKLAKERQATDDVPIDVKFASPDLSLTDCRFLGRTLLGTNGLDERRQG